MPIGVLSSYHHLLLIQKNKTLEFNRDIEIPMFFYTLN